MLWNIHVIFAFVEYSHDAAPSYRVLDEATASVDKHTDKLLHESLNRVYKDATIIKIAHRIDTIIDDDYILVLGAGQVLEYGKPAELLSRANSEFRKMVQDSGMAEEFKRANK